MHALALLQQPRPVLLLQLLLPQLEVDVRAGVVRLGGVDVDLGIELEFHVVGGLLGLGVAGEGEAAGLQVDLGLGNVGGGDREGDVVALGVGGRGALGPDDWWGWVLVREFDGLEVCGLGWGKGEDGVRLLTLWGCLLL